jgi:hypothetical protein
MHKHTRIIVGILAVLAILGASSCDDEKSANAKERATVSSNQKKLAVAQPLPTGDWSQLRQNLIEIETAQINTTATTTFFFNQGVVDPVKTCQSVGFPIPASYQLSNPEAPLYSSSHDDLTLPQQETTGVYTGDTTGTYVICIDGKGKGRIAYWEGFVQTETGPATWNVQQHAIESSGESTAEVTTDGK